MGIHLKKTKGACKFYFSFGNLQLFINLIAKVMAAEAHANASDETIKIFVGNLAPYASQYRLQKLFESFGEVVECVVLGKFAFVHMIDQQAAEEAVLELHRTLFADQRINVEISKKGNEGKTRNDPSRVDMANVYKVFVTDLPDNASDDSLKTFFQAEAQVYSCVCLSNMAIVHLVGRETTHKAVEKLHGSTYEGKQISVYLKKNQKIKDMQKNREKEFDDKSPSQKIMVRNLTELVMRQDVVDLFADFGSIQECIVLGTYGFVHMRGEANCERAINALNGKSYAGKKLVVHFSDPLADDNKSPEETIKLFVGNLKECAEEDELRSAFEQYGAVAECVVIRNGKYGFIHMVHKNDAERAVKNLHRTMVCGSRIRVDFAGGDHSKAYNTAADTVKLFVGNLNCTATEAKLEALFADYGEVVECDILKKFGFVHMATREQAENAIAGLHRKQFEGAKLNIQYADGDRGKPEKNFNRAPLPAADMDPEALPWKLHISGLGGYAVDEELRQMFEMYGDVKEVAVVGKNGFVHMIGKSRAQAACQAYNNTNYAGQNIFVSFSKENQAMHAKIADQHKPQKPVKLFCGNLTGDECTEENLRELLEKYGEVGEVAMMTCYAFAHMARREDAMKAIKNLNGQRLLGTRLRIEFHQKAAKTQRHETTKLFVGNLRLKKNQENEEMLREHFEQIGEVTDCALMGKFAFVHMADHDLACRAVDHLHNSMYEGTRLIVEISETDKGRTKKSWDSLPGQDRERGQRRGGGQRHGGGGGQRRGRQDSYGESYDDYGGYEKKRSRRNDDDHNELDDGFSTGNWKSSNYGGSGAKNKDWELGNWKSDNWSTTGSSGRGRDSDDKQEYKQQSYTGYQSQSQGQQAQSHQNQGYGQQSQAYGKQQQQGMGEPAQAVQQPSASWDMPVLKINSSKPDPYDTLGRGYNPFDSW